MKERPIIFSTPMVLAILEGRKTQTRSIVKFPDGLTTHDDWLEAHEIAPAEYVFWSGPKYVNPDFTRSVYKPGDGIICPYGQPGDRLWVRETWAEFSGIEPKVTYVYRADGLYDTPAKEHLCDNRWRPSIHMPRAASRILLEITDVRVEKLREITRSDIRSEGLVCPDEFKSDNLEYNYRHWYPDAFKSLWDGIQGPGSWDQNPWVWVITFKRIQPCLNP